MGFLAPAMPYIIQGAGTLFGGLMAKRAQNKAMQRTPEEQTSLGGAHGIAGAAGVAGQRLLSQSAQQLGQAGNYFQTLLSGNRAAQSQAIAAPVAQLTDFYRGATRNLEHSGLRGAQRDVYAGDLNRDRASKIAGLITGVQPSAAGALADIGGTAGQLGSGLTQSAGSLYSNLLGHGEWNRQYGRAEGEKSGSFWGSLIADLGKAAWGGRKKAPGGGGTPNTPPGPWAPGYEPDQPGGSPGFWGTGGPSPMPGVTPPPTAPQPPGTGLFNFAGRHF